jgi:hypothetical protein
MSQTNHTEPKWLNIPVSVRYSGLSRALIYEHIKDGTLISSSVKRPGCSRGRRVVLRESLDRLIESGIGMNSANNLGGKAVQP